MIQDQIRKEKNPFRLFGGFNFFAKTGMCLVVCFIFICFVPKVASAVAGLTISSASLAADGKTFTINMGGVSGSLSPASGITGFTIKVGSVVYPTSTLVTASGSTVTLVTSAVIATSTTVTVDLAASPTSNLTDGSSNTPQGQTGRPVTNNSAVYLTSFDATSTAIKFSGVVPTISTTFSLGARNGQLDTVITGACANFSINTSVGGTFTITVDGSISVITSIGSQQKWSLFCGLADTAHRVSITSSGGSLVSSGLFQVTGSAPSLSLPTDIGNIYNLQDSATQNSLQISSGWVYDASYATYKTYWSDEKIKFTAAPTKISIWTYNKSAPFYLERDGVVIASSTPSGASTWSYLTLASNLDGQTHTYSIGTGGYVATYSHLYGLALVGGTLGSQPSSLSNSIGGYGDSITAANQTCLSSESFLYSLAERLNVIPINRGIGGTRVIGSGDTRYADITGATPVPSYATVLYGINDVGTSAAFLTSFTNMMTSLVAGLPTTKFLVMGLLQNAYSAQRNIDIRSAITAVNNTNIHYLDASGWTLPDMNGNHPGPIGYTNMTNYIIPYMSTNSSYAVTGPTSGLPNQTSTAFTLALANGGAFDGAATSTVTISASNGTVTATASGGTITNNGTATVTVKPAVDSTNFTFTYVPTSIGAKTLTFTNGQGWTNIGPMTYTSLDAVAPLVTFTFPTVGSTVSSTIALFATSTDDIGVSGVQFYYGTTTINAEVTVTSSPNTYTTTWNTAGVSDGSYALTAVARDSSNNYATSTGVNVIVDNTAPTRANGSPNNTLTIKTTSTTLSLTTNENAICRYSTEASSSYGSMTAFTTTGSTSHSKIILGLANAVSYTYYVKCRDSQGNINASDYVVSFSVASDVSSPSVTITAPINGSTVSSTITLSATSTDDVGVTSVQFKLDGVTNLGDSGTSSPYVISWDAGTVSDGSHQISAVASDASGNQATSTVTITVDNTIPTCPTISHVSMYNAYPTCGVAACEVGYTLTNGICVALVISTTTTTTINRGLSSIPPPTLAMGTGANTATIAMGSTGNIGQLQAGGTNVLAYVDSQANFIATVSQTTQTENHTLKIIDLDLLNNVITIQIESTPQIIKLKLNNFAKVDLNNDKIPDLSVKFAAVNVNRAELTLDSITAGDRSRSNITVSDYLFKQDLKLGMTSRDVKELQKYLNAHGFLIAKSGPGSSGKETTKFGIAVKNALIRFQKAYQITPAVGYFGKVTRDKVNVK